MHFAALLMALQVGTVHVGPAPAPDTLSLRPDSADMATAYPDADTRDLVRSARGRRDAIDRSVFHYTATSRQRLSVGIRAFRRDRLLYRREGVSSIEWWRDRPARVVVHGAREAVPVALPGIQLPDDVAEWARSFVPGPDDDRLWIDPVGESFAWHPLVEGGEALYRYATGDTIRIRLPDGTEVRLVELRVTPRERDIRVVTGSFWIELENHSVVQAVFRPAREFNLERDLPGVDSDSEDDLDELPSLLKPIRFDMRYATVEYGLWEMRWWMPRLMAMEGTVQVGAVRMPIAMEIAYSDYMVEEDRHRLPELPPLTFQLAGDRYARPRRHVPGIRVVVEADTAALLDSPYFSRPFFSEGEAVMTEGELRDLGERLGALPPPPWEVARPVVTPPWHLGAGLLRYNRIEGLSAGARLDWDLTRLRLDLTGRLGIADLMPRAELGVVVPAHRQSWRLAAYHRLAPAGTRVRPLALGNSLSALVLGRDDGMYYQTSGAELRISPPEGSTARYGIRLYAEHQGPVDRATEFSLAQLAGGRLFRENIRAERADQLGLQGSAAVNRGLDPTGYRWGAAFQVTAETGSYTFLRPGLTLRGSTPLPGRLVGAVELAGGTTLSADRAATHVPVQAHWYLGGPHSLRGSHGGELAGRDYARGRVEVTSRFPGARVIVFGDGGWAGRFDGWSSQDLALSAGVGGSLLDGLLRLDLARTIQPVERWRLDLYLDALF